MKKIDFNKIIGRLILFISIGVGAHILFLLFTTDKEILLQVKKIKFRYLMTIGGLVLVPWIGHAIRMVLWTRFLKCKLTFRETLKIAVSTDLGAALTPTIIGGGPVKLAMLLRQKVPASKAGILIALGGFEDLLFYLAGISLGLVFAFDSIMKILSSIYQLLTENLLLIGGVGTLIILYISLRKAGVMTYRLNFLKIFPPRIKRLILKTFIGFRRSIKETKSTLVLILNKGKLTFLLSFTILIIQWFAKFSILSVILYALGVDVSFINIYLRQWLVWLTMIFIPTPGATGGAEASFYLLFGPSIPSGVLTLIVSTWRFFTYYFIMLSAVFIYQFTSYLSYMRNKKAI